MGMKQLPRAPVPAEDQPARLRQIGELMACMKAEEVLDNFPGRGRVGAGSTNVDKTVGLSWLPQPVYRYSDPARGIIDGALCFACYKTNPGVVLVLEARRHGSSPPAWYCGFARHSYYKLRVRFDDKEFWTAQPLPRTAGTEPYYIWGVPL